ncbi:MAG TPA: ABC transporter permease [Bryobacteraceae bacterium]|nr:ABC transporter permease [Bryobacteraceae bacterium]
MSWMHRFCSMFQTRKLEEQLDDELQFHVEMRTQEFIAAGMDLENARYRARRLFGNQLLLKERTRDMDTIGWIETLGHDLRYGLRMLAKNPGFTTMAVLTLALGIGANTAVFSIVNGVLLNPLPFWQPDQLVALHFRTPDGTSSTSYPNFLDWAHDNRSFSALAAYRPDNFNLTGMGEPERLPGEMLSASFFPLLGVQPILGRTFLPDEDRLGSAPVALISAGFWKCKFNSSPDALGKALTLNGAAHTIVGVIPPNFRYHSSNFPPSDVFVPIGQWSEPSFRDRRIRNSMDTVGRLKPGVTFDQANADLGTLGRHLADQYPDANKGTGVMLVPLKRDVVGNVQTLLSVLQAAVGFVLLIACVNIANLFLARSRGRTRELAIRTALGASRGRVVRQLLTESILLAVTGGGIGVLIASWGTQAALKLLPEVLPRADEVSLDGRVLLVMAAASVLAGILFGLAPALRNSPPALHETLKEGGRGSSGARHRTQSVFVVVEMALALILLAGAGLMIRSLAKLWSVDPGFDPHNVLTARVSGPAIASPDAVRALWRQMNNKLRVIPGVKAASLSAGSSPMGGDAEIPFWLEGQAKPSTQAEMKWAINYFVQPDYLSVLRIPLKRGRFLTAEDHEHSPLVIVIDDQFARQYFANDNPISRRIHFDILNATAEIVGVVGHVKQWGLDESSASHTQPQCYFSAFQIPDQFMPLVAGDVGIAIRTEGTPLAHVAIRQALNQINGHLVLYRTQTMDGIISGSLAERRFSMILLGSFAALALLMACIGIYGVVSHLAGQRTHEIGIRMALGAERRDVLRMVLGEGAKMALVGILLGLMGAFALTRLMASMLFGVSTHDPLTFTGVAILLALVALMACYIPARRASSVDPTEALRYE